MYWLKKKKEIQSNLSCHNIIIVAIIIIIIKNIFIKMKI